MRTIGVFDSGIGGLSVVQAIKKDLKNPVIFVNDQKNVPYGDKTPEELYALVLPILKDLATKTDIIVVACNSVTTTLITELRINISVPLVGMEPMVKPAAQLSKSGTIAVCATPTTLISERYKWLKHSYAQDINVLEPDCSDWAFMIESNQVDQQAVSARIDEVCSMGADVIVLGCTHYHWIEDLVRTTAANRAIVLQPEKPVLEQLKKVLKQIA